MVLHALVCGRVGRCRFIFKKACEEIRRLSYVMGLTTLIGGAFFCASSLCIQINPTRFSTCYYVLRLLAENQCLCGQDDCWEDNMSDYECKVGSNFGWPITPEISGEGSAKKCAEKLTKETGEKYHYECTTYEDVVGEIHHHSKTVCTIFKTEESK